MKKVLELVLIVSLVFLLAACGTTQPEDTGDTQTLIVEPIPSQSDFPQQDNPFNPDGELTVCPDCGDAIDDDWFYCAWCGTKLRDDGKEIPWHVLASLDELEGTWTSGNGITIHYPDYSLGTSVAMVSITWPTKDDTTLWRQKASQLGITLEQAWTKRNLLRKEIYGPILIDENGTQIGVLCTKNAFNFICSNEMIFLPEKIVRDNASFFEVSPDGTKLTMKGSFHFFSDLAFQLTGDETIYTKKVEEVSDEN